MESLVRLKFNGPAVEDLNVLRYAKNFVKKHKYVDALPKYERKKKLHLKKNDEELAEDEIYFSRTIIY